MLCLLRRKDGEFLAFGGFRIEDVLPNSELSISYFVFMSSQNILLEEEKPLRNSMIWDLQDQFYMRKGPSCWTDAIVPHFVTSNSYIAYQYANCILGYIRDYYSS